MLVPLPSRHAVSLSAVKATLPSCSTNFWSMVKRGMAPRPVGGLVLWLVQPLCQLAAMPCAAKEALDAQCALLQWLHPWAVAEEEALAVNAAAALRAWSSYFMMCMRLYTKHMGRYIYQAHGSVYIHNA